MMQSTKWAGRHSKLSLQREKAAPEDTAVIQPNSIGPHVRTGARVQENERGYAATWVWANALENLSITAQMEGIIV
jgi:hypothetical protein